MNIVVAIAMLCANSNSLSKSACEKEMTNCVLSKGLSELNLLKCIQEGKAD